MKVLRCTLIFLLLAGCSSMPSYESGDISIRTSQLGERMLKVALYDQQRSPMDHGTLRVSNNRGDILQETDLRKRIAFIQYPMHESSIIIEATSNDTLKGKRQFFRSQLREIRLDY